MERDDSLGSHLKLTLAGLSEQGVKHLSEIESDLLQTNLLLEEAIAKLSASFMAVHGAISIQQEMVDSIAESERMTPESVSGIKTIADEIGRHINDAVTGLQFQDMTRQLIERSLKRVIGMRAMMSSLSASKNGLSQEASTEQIVAILRSVNKQLFLQNRELTKALWKTVRQKHMDSGDIELF
ncbi:MAG: chemotaxis protein [Oxalobacter sp.]|nr:MAG: chemotaxis protein [Oxalobacter sp.]